MRQNSRWNFGIWLIGILWSSAAANKIDSSFNILLRVSDIERILPLAYYSLTHIHPAIAKALDSATTAEIESNLREEVPKDLFFVEIRKVFEKRYSESNCKTLYQQYSDSLIIEFQKNKKEWNSVDGQKACQERKDEIELNTTESKREYTKIYLKQENATEKTLELFDRALGAQIALILKSKTRPIDLTETKMKKLSGEYRKQIVEATKGSMAKDYYCLFETYDMSHLNKIYQIQEKKEIKWFDNIIWDGLANGYRVANSKIKLGKK